MEAGSVVRLFCGSYFPTIKLLLTILQRRVSGDFSDAGLKKLATALPDYIKTIAYFSDRDEDLLVVVDSTLRFIVGGERALIEGERGRLAFGKLAMTKLWKFLTEEEVHPKGILDGRQIHE